MSKMLNKLLIWGAITSCVLVSPMIYAQSGPPLPEKTDVAQTQPAQAQAPKRAYVGFVLKDDLSKLSDEKLKALNLPEGSGLIVDFVQPDTPADEAGIQLGMVIARIDGQPVFGIKHFVGLLKMKKPGDNMVFTVVDEKGEKNHNVTLGARSDIIDAEIKIDVDKGHPKPTNMDGPHALTDTKITIRDPQNIIVINVKPDGQQSIVVYGRKWPRIVLYQGPLTSLNDQKRLPWEIARKINHYYNQNKLKIRWVREMRTDVSQKKPEKHNEDEAVKLNP